MKKHNIKDLKRRKKVKSLEFKRLQYKYIALNTNLDLSTRTNAQYLLNSLSKDSSKVRVKNRCILTGRAKGVYKDFRLSRIMFRDLSLKGLLPGVQKSSW